MTNQPVYEQQQRHHIQRQRALAQTPTWQLPSQPAAARLQRSLGNQALGQLAGRMAVQAKLTLGPVGDQYEQEADQVAKQVVQQMDTPAVATANNSPTAQREVDLSQEEKDPTALATKRFDQIAQRATPPTTSPLDEKEQLGQAKPAIQRSATFESGPVSTEVESAIQRERGSGQPLADGVRGAMESSFGADFSSVNVHTGRAADSLNQQLQARAFTTGKDIFFRQGEYNPGSRGGRELLAHELTHVVQQTGRG